MTGGVTRMKGRTMATILRFGHTNRLLVSHRPPPIRLVRMEGVMVS
jgi:hypothetical protein